MPFATIPGQGFITCPEGFSTECCEPPVGCPPGCVPAALGDPLSGTGGCPPGCKPETILLDCLLINPALIPITLSGQVSGALCASEPTPPSVCCQIVVPFNHSFTMVKQGASTVWASPAAPAIAAGPAVGGWTPVFYFANLQCGNPSTLQTFPGWGPSPCQTFTGPLSWRLNVAVRLIFNWLGGGFSGGHQIQLIKTPLVQSPIGAYQQFGHSNPYLPCAPCATSFTFTASVS